MNKEEMYMAIFRQKALDMNCAADDFRANINIVVASKENSDEKKSAIYPYFCNLTSFGKNVVASVDKRIFKVVNEYLENAEPYKCFEAPRIHKLTKDIAKYGKVVCCMNQYYLPNLEEMRFVECGYQVKAIVDYGHLYVKEFSHAMNKNKKNLYLDVVVAMDGEKVVGVSACTKAMGDLMFMGVEVLPEYRGRGIGTAVLNRMALGLLNRRKIPCFCSSWANLATLKLAANIRFLPAWTELIAISKDKTKKFM